MRYEDAQQIGARKSNLNRRGALQREESDARGPFERRDLSGQSCAVQIVRADTDRSYKKSRAMGLLTASERYVACVDVRSSCPVCLTECERLE